MMVWVPSATAVESHVTPYALVVSSAPMLVLVSSLNWTPATLALSDAFAVTETPAPDTVDPPDGAVRDTVGGVVSPVL